MTDPKRFDVVGLGQCSFDILGRLDLFPQVDQKTELQEMKFEGGGPVATALVALARLGVPVAFCGRIGDDHYGSMIRAGLLQEGVDCSGLLTANDASSQIAFITVDESGRRTIFWHRGTAPPLLAAEVDQELIRQTKILHLDGLQADASLAAARYAHEQGVITVLDGGTLRKGTPVLLPWVDHLVVSEKFAEQLLPGGTVPAKLDKLLSYGAGAATLTLGAYGSWSQERGGEPFHQPAFEVEVVDTTGCGDVFHGGYIYGLLQGWPLPRVVELAAAAAALKAQGLGGRSAIPDLHQLKSCLNIK